MTINRISLITGSLLLSLAACVDVVDDSDDPDTDSQTFELAAPNATPDPRPTQPAPPPPPPGGGGGGGCIRAC
jgi:hypothetical protein